MRIALPRRTTRSAGETPRIGEAVRDFYERYPVSSTGRQPRDVSAPLAGSAATSRRLSSVLARQSYPRRTIHPHRRLRDVSGGQACRCAGPRLSVTGIDFSATSVRCTEELKRKYSLDNLQVRRLPIERVGDLEIELRSDRVHRGAPPSCRPGRGAQGSARRAQAGRSHASHGVRAVRTDRHLHAAGVLQTHRHPRHRRGDPGSRHCARVLCRPDIRWEACCARPRTSGTRPPSPTPFLHPQDRAYSVPQLFDLLEKGGLTFGRWVRQAPYAPRCGVMARIPQASRIAQLPLPEQYAAAELFRGTMVRHSLVAYRDDGPGGRSTCQFCW